MLDSSSVRCKACDTLFSSVWIEEHKRWEDMCPTCIRASFIEEVTDDDYMVFIEYEGKIGHE